MNDTLTSAPPLPDPAEKPDPVLVFKNVTIAFDGPPVLEDIGFSVGPHETRILLGPAGVGKSVLLKLANGLHCPDTGSILLFGENIARVPEQMLFRGRGARTRTWRGLSVLLPLTDWARPICRTKFAG